MIIKRDICGTEVAIELTAQELYLAHEAQEHIYDVANTREYLSDVYSDEEIDSIAWEARRQANKYDLGWDCAVEEALCSLQLWKEA